MDETGIFSKSRPGLRRSGIPTRTSQFPGARPSYCEESARRRPYTRRIPRDFGERLREEASHDLRDRDYDIMAQMADGIRPILDRLDEIEDPRHRYGSRATQPVPAGPRGWLSARLGDTLTGLLRSNPESAGRTSTQRAGNRDSYRNDRASGHEALPVRWPGNCRRQIEEQHVRTTRDFRQEYSGQTRAACFRAGAKRAASRPRPCISSASTTSARKII